MSHKTYRGFRLERVVNAPWLRTELRNRLPKECRSLISGWYCHYPDGIGSMWATTLEQAEMYIDSYLAD